MIHLSRHTYYKNLAILTARRGTCPRAQVGCVLVDADTKRIAAVGYNSSHSGTPHCMNEGCLVVDNHCIRTLHAEVAAAINLERKYKRLYAYVTHEPCDHCYKVLASEKVIGIYYGHAYKNEKREILQDIIKIPVLQWDNNSPEDWAEV